MWQTVGSGKNAAPGAAGSSRSIVKILTALADNTYTTIANVVVPNAIAGAGLRITATGTTGDGDSTSTGTYHASIARLAGAAAGAAVGSIAGAATQAGTTATAALSIQWTTASGGITASQTIPLQMKLNRTAGTSTGHVIVASIELLNSFGSGITFS